MDVAKSLVRCVARAFYDVKHVLVIDALMIHNALRDDDMAHLLGLQTKDLHKLCGKLKEDRMLHVTTRSEQKENQQRPVNRIYYYVDYRATIDAVKYRMHKVVKEVERKMNKDADAKGYVCPRCNKQYAALDLDILVPTLMGFLCDRCDTELVDDDDSVEVKSSQERLGRLMDQMKPVIDFLKKIDEVVVPQNEFEDAFRNRVEVSRVKTQLSGAAPPDVPYAKNNLTTTSGTAVLEVNFTSTSEKSAQELAAQEAKKSAQMQQNALPVWHTQSTVSGEITKLGLKEAAARQEREGFAPLSKQEGDEKKPAAEESGVQADAIEQYYAALRAKQAQEAAEEEEEEDDEEEDDEFEDVVADTATTTAAATSTTALAPAKNVASLANKNGTASSLNITTKVNNSGAGSESDSSAGGGSVLPPPVKKAAIEPPTKKVKTEERGAAKVAAKEDSEEEDDEEFEDV